MHVLDVANLSVAFGPVSAISGVDLHVGSGEIVALCGEPGAGKTALVRSIAGDLPPAAGDIRVNGAPLGSGLRAAARRGIAVVWQDVTLCESLDVAGNLLLGQETPHQLWSNGRFYSRTAELLASLRIPIHDPMQTVDTLSNGQRRLLALAAALVREPRVLLLDEPTASLGLVESRHVERLLMEARSHGVAILLASRDIAQVFRLADRIVVLRRGRVAAELQPQESHPDDVTVLLSGGALTASARHQLTRLHGLADRLALAEPSSGLALIVSALAAALGIDRDRVDVIRAETATPAPVGESVIVNGQTWLVPVAGAAGISAVITVKRESPEPPNRDEHDLLGLYAGYAAAAIERQEAETAQREAAALRRSRELQREFLSRLSHELRTPLTAIRGYASSLMAGDIVWDKDSEQRFLERIAAESARLGRLVNDLLDFSAIESGVLRLQRDWCELGLVIEAAVACLPGAWPSAVTVAANGQMPAIWADHDRLEQVLVNLLSNALRHNPEGTHVTVTVASPDRDRVEITVSDDGPGLPEAVRNAPFDSTAGARSRTAGAGLGLSISRGIVEAHGGTIDVHSCEAGTSFRIVLPVESDGAPPEPRTTAVATPVAGGSPARGETSSPLQGVGSHG